MATPRYPEGNVPDSNDSTIEVLHKILNVQNGDSGIGSSEDAPVYVTSPSYHSQVSIIRPSNTTAYTANDVIGVADSGTPANAGSAIHELTNIGPAEGGSVLLTDIDLRFDIAASGPTGAFRLHLYRTAPDAILDNAAWDLSSSGDRGKYIGYVDLGSVVDLGSTLFVQASNINRMVVLTTGSLFVQLVTIAGYTPASGTVATLNARSIGI